MFLVERPTLTPSCCLVSKRSDRECIDLGRDFDFDHSGRMYISTSVVRDMARLIGMIDPSDDAQLVERLTEELDQAKEQIASLERQISAIEVLESEGYRARKKPGRPPKTKEKANA